MNSNKYKIIKELSKTNFSIIYLANDKISDKPVVIKELNFDLSYQREKITFIRREAEYLQKITHKNVVKFLEYFEENNSAYLVLEYIEGTSIDKYIKSKRLIKYDEAENIFKQMCLAILEIHKYGIIHRDIKPGNFLIDKNDVVKLIDFGISIDIIKQDPSSEKVYTRNFASPEQISGNEPLDIRTDIYSLGKTFYFLLTGRFTEDTTILLNKQNFENEITEFKDPRYVNPDIPIKDIEIIKKCLQNDKRKRYQSVKQILEDLETEVTTNDEYKDFNLYENFEGSFVLDKNYGDSDNAHKWTLQLNLKRVKLKPKNPDFILNLLHNYINRGNPTLCSLKLAYWIVDNFPDSVVDFSDEISFNFKIKDSVVMKEINQLLSLAAALQNTLLILLRNRIISFSDYELAFEIDERFQGLLKVVIDDFLELAENYFTLNNLEFVKPAILINDKLASNPIKIIIGQNNYTNNAVLLNENDNISTFFKIKASIPSPYIINNEESFNKALLYFLNNIFRFKEFRFGQLKIIKRALTLKNTVGLLPTGAGKSLCYQLIMFLQPAPIVIIEPIKSLIDDQLHNLKKFLINRVNIITSNQPSNEREFVQNSFSEGKYLALYVSPERFQISLFRKYLNTLIQQFPIAYAVIDEAHCVSEWGHDFRTSYLGLAKTIRKYCNHYGFIPTFYALTGTASEIVLKDILNDLEILDDYENAVIRNHTFDRQELKFSIIKCSSEKKFEALKSIFDNISKNLRANSVVDLFKPNKHGCGLIFCPHVNSTNYSVSYLNKKIGETFSLDLLGVEEESKRSISPKCPRCGSDMKVRKNRKDLSKFWGCSRYPNCKGTINIDNFQSHGGEFDYDIKHFRGLGMYSGKPIQGFNSKNWESYKKEIHMKFIKDEISCMISTKSFGMGIDKPNVRYTIHYNLPQSIESFYQEAGRAGRDGKTAYCYIIFSDDSPDVDNKFLDISKKADELWSLQHNSYSDIGRNLYFQKEAYIGEIDEIKKVKSLLLTYIYPNLNKIATLQSTEIEIPDADKNEKYLFRLKTFGLIDDYVIDYYQNFNKIFSNIRITIVKLNSGEYLRYLIDYFKIRNEKLLAEKIETEIKTFNFTSIEDEIEYCISKIISFVYEKIEPQRRASLRNIVDACRSETIEEFRKKILRYLSPDEEINFDFNLFPNSKNYEDWISIINKAINSNQLDKYLGVTLRIIESYPQEPGLFYISFIIRMLLPNENQNLIKEDLIAFIRFYKMHIGTSKLDSALLTLLIIVMQYSDRDNILDKLLMVIVKNISRKDYLLNLNISNPKCIQTKFRLQTIILALIRGKLKIKKPNLGKYEYRRKIFQSH